MERDSVRAENPSPVFANGARIYSPAKWARKSEKISCNRNGISARAEKTGNNMAAAWKKNWLRLKIKSYSLSL